MLIMLGTFLLCNVSIHTDVLVSLPIFAFRQQRHRTKLTTPLSRETMFKGNPRKPGHLSFENIQFMIDNDRIERLEPASSASEVNIMDEWIITYLSSDQVTGLCHEIDILESLGLIEIKPGGEIRLAPGWQKLCPHMILNEMRDSWGKDIHNLHCIHDSIRSLSKYWECIEGEGWRSSSGGEDLAFEEDEYEMRRQIFSENFLNYVDETLGVGHFVARGLWRCSSRN